MLFGLGGGAAQTEQHKTCFCFSEFSENITKRLMMGGDGDGLPAFAKIT